MGALLSVAAGGVRAVVAAGVSLAFTKLGSALVAKLTGCAKRDVAISMGREVTDKMMKAPGQNLLIPRKAFEDDPSSYFRDLCGKN